jgi:hypothetical protein
MIPVLKQAPVLNLQRAAAALWLAYLLKFLILSCFATSASLQTDTTCHYRFLADCPVSGRLCCSGTHPVMPMAMVPVVLSMVPVPAADVSLLCI